MSRSASGTAITHVVRCEHCGGSISIQSLVPQVWCPSCGRPKSIEHEWLAGADVYAAQVQFLLEISEHDQENRAADRISGRLAIKIATGVGCFLLGLAVLGVAALFDLAFAAFYLVFFGWVASPMLIRAAPDMIARWRHRQGAIGTPATTKTVPCPACSGVNQLTAGAAVGACTYCGASLAVAIRQMWISAWQLTIEVRAAAARARAPGRFKFALRDRVAEVRYLGIRPQPWNYLWELAAALGGSCGGHGASRWLQGYWPESIDELFQLGGHNFIWGAWRGYPVGVFAAGRFHVILIPAIASPARSLVKTPQQTIYRTTAGYMGLQNRLSDPLSARELLGRIDHLCLTAHGAGFPPAPFIEPAPVYST